MMHNRGSNRKQFAVMAILVTGLFAGRLLSQENVATNRDTDGAAVKEAIQGFTTAFEKGDAEVAVAYLTSGAELVADDAPAVVGREAIQQALLAHFAKNSRVKIELAPDSIRFPSRDTAISEGLMRVVPEGGDPSHNNYSISLVREDGKWRITLIHEWPHEQPALEQLEWLVGTWISKQADAEIQTTYEWFGNKSFIRAQFFIREKDKSFTGMQMIGTDSQTGALRTWTFEVGGGFGEGFISREGKDWTFEMATTLPTGETLEVTNLLIQLDQDSFTWQPLNLTIDGEQFGDLPPAKVSRVPSN
ncbi:MAG: SgcJ/EcaC family oxidoreductase [Pirellulaceae bacterium]|nr:SgcJ/EcaC family oxidoreductase [Pirellulaceae bacterium]